MTGSLPDSPPDSSSEHMLLSPGGNSSFSSSPPHHQQLHTSQLSASSQLPDLSCIDYSVPLRLLEGDGPVIVEDALAEQVVRGATAGGNVAMIHQVREQSQFYSAYVRCTDFVLKC